MREKNENNPRQNPVKLALAVGLTIVFIVVVAVQVKTYSGDATGSTSSTAPQGPMSRPGQGNQAHGKGNASQDTNTTIPWPKVELADCTRHDPFATPDSFVVKKVTAAERTSSEDARRRELELARQRAAREQTLSKLKETGVRAIFKGPSQSVAILGDDTIRVGQEIYGYRVVAIEDNGIILEPISD